jgi:hypothetical protein
MELLEQVPGDDILKDEVGELLWAFTVLAAGPQPGAPTDLDARLERLGLKGLVDARMRQMDAKSSFPANVTAMWSCTP